jgi:hypothetical protein
VRGEAQSEGRGEEAVRRAAERVMDAMRSSDAREIRDPGEPGDREALVDEAVVANQVRRSEQGHADPGPDGERARAVVRRLASPDDQTGCDGRMKRRQHIVGLEAAETPQVMRAMDGPQRPVPGARVEEPGPRLHRARDDERRAGRDQREHQRSPLGAS